MIGIFHVIYGMFSRRTALRQKTRFPAQTNVRGLLRHRRNAGPQPVPTFQPDPKAPPPPKPLDTDDEAIEAAINRMVEAAYT